MGDYNPNIPYIMGNEWVPIRNEAPVYAPSINLFEQGSTFSQTFSSTLQDGRFYVNELPAGAAAGQVFMMTVYPTGTEHLSGPIQRVIIPVNGGGVTGTGAVIGGGASTITEALADSSDGKNVRVVSNSAAGFFGAYFDTGTYAQQLNGKRILAVNLLYSMSGNLSELASVHSSTNPSLVSVALQSQADGVTVSYGATSYGTMFGDQGTSEFVPGPKNLFRMELGEINPFWNPGVSPRTTSERFIFNYAGLARMQATAANRFFVRVGSLVGSGAPTGIYVAIHYLALEIIYCDDNRVALGARSFGYDLSQPNMNTPYVLGQNIITMRDLAGTASPVLTFGDFSVVLSSANLGTYTAGIVGLTASVDYPLLNGTREHRGVPANRPVKVTIPFPLDDTAVGRVFEVSHPPVVPQLSLHTSTGPVEEVHSYGQILAAPVYGTITATQAINDGSAGFPLMPSGAVPWPQVRYYARRFGDTTVPLKLDSTTVTGSSVEITPSDFDDLPEILDGWREVTLRFTAPPSMGNLVNDQMWRWSASGELAANRWEVLGATAVSISGTPGNLTAMAPNTHRLGSTTYGAPIDGAATNLTWKSPLVSGAAADELSDATLMFSQDPPTVTGFGVVQATQELSLIDPTCGLDRCTPTGIRYHALSWSPVADSASDEFERTVSNGWGTADYGGTWTTLNGVASDYSVSGGYGQHTHGSRNVRRTTLLPISAINVDMTFAVVVPELMTGGPAEVFSVMRYQDSSNHWLAGIVLNANGTVDGYVARRVGGTLTAIRQATALGVTYTAGVTLRVRTRITYDIIHVRVWRDGTPEPDYWSATVTDSALNVFGQVGLQSKLDSTSTNTLPLVFRFDELSVIPTYFGSYELQRYDAYEGEWKTIMLASRTGISSFNDYEARVGVESRYRIRVINVSDFEGAWSAEVANTLSSPGVTSAGAPTGVTIFTTNETQDGSQNLAYVETWDGSIEEDFQFPEGRRTEYRQLMNRDYVVAFKPTERSGERFSRTILVQAAAVAETALERSFQSLRDLAWSQVNYICVRDEIGSRWLADVNVPGGSVMRNRRLRLVNIDVLEVTATPTPVDPGA